MAATIVTPSDLEELKEDLLKEINRLLKQRSGSHQSRWLKNSEIRKMLKVSTSTLQTLRINGTLPFTKLGGIIYYDREVIENLMLENQVRNGHAGI
jgi:hypothetical protein